MTARRGTTNRNQRGSSYARRRRREWLVAEFGDGVHVACFLQLSPHCLWVLDVDTVSADRLVAGGGYGRDNLQPACLPCQSLQGGLMRAASLKRTQVLTPTK